MLGAVVVGGAGRVEVLAPGRVGEAVAVVVLEANVAPKANKVDALGTAVCNKVDVLETVVADKYDTAAVASEADKVNVVPGVIVSEAVKSDVLVVIVLGAVVALTANVVLEVVVAGETGRVEVVLEANCVGGTDDVALRAVVAPGANRVDAVPGVVVVVGAGRVIIVPEAVVALGADRVGSALRVVVGETERVNDVLGASVVSGANRVDIILGAVVGLGANGVVVVEADRVNTVLGTAEGDRVGVGLEAAAIVGETDKVDIVPGAVVASGANRVGVALGTAIIRVTDRVDIVL